MMTQPIFRFAPSPNGLLHLGHAYSALFSQQLCQAMDGRMLLRIEDIDVNRCRPEFEEALTEDLRWLGFRWEGEILRQSDCMNRYATILEDLEQAGLVYRAFLSRNEIRNIVGIWENKSGKTWPSDPDGAAIYPGNDRDMARNHSDTNLRIGEGFSLRIDNEAALKHAGIPSEMCWDELAFDTESGENTHSRKCADAKDWGDFILGRRDIKTSYHLSCVIDDAYQRVTHIVRGKDLFAATSIHCLLQKLLGYQQVSYCHHDLIVDDEGNKLSKRHNDTSIRELREAGATPLDIRRMIGL